MAQAENIFTRAKKLEEKLENMQKTWDIAKAAEVEVNRVMWEKIAKLEAKVSALQEEKAHTSASSGHLAIADNEAEIEGGDEAEVEGGDEAEALNRGSFSWIAKPKPREFTVTYKPY